MQITFEGKVALVTGAAGGIGLATARMFAEAGAAVALVDISKTVMERAEELCKAGHRAIGIVCDVADEQQVAQAVERTVGEFGRLDCAYNNVGIHAPRVNCICPGTSDTPMVQQAIREAPKHMEAVIDAIPVGRLGRAEEIASAVLWLCSDLAGFAIGSQVVMDGGYTII